MIQHIYSALPLKCTNIVQVLSWNLQYGTRCARMQRNILKERTQLVEAKLANSKWTNHQPHTVWCLGFAVSVLPAWSSLAVLHIVVVFRRKYCDKRAQPKFSWFLVFLIKFPSFSMSGRFFEAFPDLLVVPVAVRSMHPDCWNLAELGSFWYYNLGYHLHWPRSIWHAAVDIGQL